MIKSVAIEAFGNIGYFILLGVAVLGVVVSIYYYFGIVRSIFWGSKKENITSVYVGIPIRFVLVCCVIGMLYLGLLPNKPVKWVESAANIEIKLPSD